MSAVCRSMKILAVQVVYVWRARLPMVDVCKSVVRTKSKKAKSRMDLKCILEHNFKRQKAARSCFLFLCVW